MNKVRLNENTNENIEFSVNELIDKLMQNKLTAFIGHVLSETTEDKLFLITYNGIIQASDPSNTWTESNTKVWVVNRFVDVEITVK